MKSEEAAAVKTKYLILGAGPTGLGAANRLKEKGENDFLVLEKNLYPGGLSASFKDAQGFTWDVGGHVVFSHYEYFDRLLEELLGDHFLSHQRKSFIRILETWVPYPFQNNIHHLPAEEQWECIEGLLETNGSTPAPADFGQWILKVFGTGIARLFMFPYNFKVWAYPPDELDWRWIGERVSVIDLKRVLRNIVLHQDDVSWGPNNAFRFPLTGGTGEIFTRLARRFEDKILYGAEAVELNPKEKTVLTADGRSFSYSFLLNTGPLDRLALEQALDVPQEIRDAAAQLEHNGVHVVGVGVDRPGESDTCWMYFPENNCPFYRATNFHNYSPHNTPKPGEQTAFMAEVSFSHHKQEALSSLMDESIRGLEAVKLMAPEDRKKILSKWETTVAYGYPIPSRGRDGALRAVQHWFEQHQVYSRGRFGGWKYEVANMDHSLMQGVEWVERMLFGEKEKTYVLS